MLARAAQEHALSKDISDDRIAGDQAGTQLSSADGPFRGTKRKIAEGRRLANLLFLSNAEERPAKRRTLPWNTLPRYRWHEVPEVRCKLWALLSRPDLKSARLVSRSWAESALPTLLDTVYLRADLKSFENLQEISQDTKLCRHVKKVVYDGRTLDRRAAGLGFLNWLRHTAGTGLGLVAEARHQLTSQLDDTELESCYINFHSRVSGQDYVLRRNNAKRMLVAALQQLPYLSAVEYVVPNDTVLSCTAPLVQSLSTRAREILAEPLSYAGYHESEGRFWTLVQSACVAGHARRLRTVRGSHLSLKRWNAAALLGDCIDVWAALQHLSLEFTHDQRVAEDMTTLGSIIASAPSLRSLRISFDTLSVAVLHAVVHLPQVIYPTVRWEHLERLSLQAVVTSEICLRRLLESHARTLRSLELSEITFEPGLLKKRTVRGSWVNFIHFLSATLTLEHVRFDGCFSNQWDEGWVSRDPEDERWPGSANPAVPYPADCLKFRIERFITHEGDSPFSPNTYTDDGWSGDYNLPWVFAEDQSWRFEGRE